MRPRPEEAKFRECRNDRANRRSGEIEKTIAFLPGDPMKRGMELVSSGISVAIEKERDKQTQNDLKDSLGKCTPAPQDDCLRSGSQPGQFLQPHRTALVQVV